MSKPYDVNDTDFRAEVVEANGPVLVDFWAAWCGPCRMIAPLLEELAEEHAGELKVAKLNVDENPFTAAQYRVQSIPTLLLFKEGEPVQRMVGALPKEMLVAQLEQHLDAEAVA